MTDLMPKSVEEQLNVSLKQVELMLMIDTVCDNSEDDVAALAGAVSLISQALEAEIGLLELVRSRYAPAGITLVDRSRRSAGAG